MPSSLDWCKSGLQYSAVQAVYPTRTLGQWEEMGLRSAHTAFTKGYTLTEDYLCPVEGEPWVNLHKGATWASLGPICPRHMNLSLFLPSSCHTPARVAAPGASLDCGPWASDQASILPLLTGCEEWPQDRL